MKLEFTSLYIILIKCYTIQEKTEVLHYIGKHFLIKKKKKNWSEHFNTNHNVCNVPFCFYFGHAFLFFTFKTAVEVTVELKLKNDFFFFHNKKTGPVLLCLIVNDKYVKNI